MDKYNVYKPIYLCIETYKKKMGLAKKVAIN